jgi:hypothetical protein
LTTPFQSVAWNTNDTATVTKLNQMTNNDQYLFENLAKVRYKSNAITRDTSMKILALRSAYSATTARQVRMDVYFDGFFSSGCSPVCVASAVTNSQKRLNVVVAGLGNGSLAPDSRGAFLQIEADEIYPVGTDQLGGMIYGPGYIDMIAIGY